MKHLTITYDPGTGPVQLFDGPVEELLWTDTAAGVRVEGKTRKPAATGGAGLMDLISAASKTKAAKRPDPEVQQ